MFTIEELSIIKIYADSKPERDRVVAALNDILPFIEEPEIKETVKSAIHKAKAMTQEAFNALDFTDTFELEGAEDQDTENE